MTRRRRVVWDPASAASPTSARSGSPDSRSARSWAATRTRPRARADRFDDRTTRARRLADALARPGVDAVTIATPPHSHGPLVLEALRSGKHVLCEKPFARDTAEAARRCSTPPSARASCTCSAPSSASRPDRRCFARVVRGGAIGEPRLATFLLHIPLLADADAEVPDWWSDADQGGGWLGAHASHVDRPDPHHARRVRERRAPPCPNVGGHSWSAEDAYLVHFRLRDGCTGRPAGRRRDRGPMLFATRVAGTRGHGLGRGRPGPRRRQGRNAASSTRPPSSRSRRRIRRPPTCCTARTTCCTRPASTSGRTPASTKRFRARIEGDRRHERTRSPERSRTASPRWRCSMPSGSPRAKAGPWTCADDRRDRRRYRVRLLHPRTCAAGRGLRGARTRRP